MTNRPASTATVPTKKRRACVFFKESSYQLWREDGPPDSVQMKLVVGHKSPCGPGKNIVTASASRMGIFGQMPPTAAKPAYEPFCRRAGKDGSSSTLTWSCGRERSGTHLWGKAEVRLPATQRQGRHRVRGEVGHRINSAIAIAKLVRSGYLSPNIVDELKGVVSVTDANRFTKRVPCHRASAPAWCGSVKRGRMLGSWDQ